MRLFARAVLPNQKKRVGETKNGGKAKKQSGQKEDFPKHERVNANKHHGDSGNYSTACAILRPWPTCQLPRIQCPPVSSVGAALPAGQRPGEIQALFCLRKVGLDSKRRLIMRYRGVVFSRPAKNVSQFLVSNLQICI
jgi:hypothetical protein